MRAAPERRRVAATIVLTLVAMTVASTATAQDGAGYRVPDQSLVDIIDAPGAAYRANERQRRFDVTVVPAPIRGPQGSVGMGGALSVTF